MFNYLLKTFLRSFVNILTPLLIIQRILIIDLKSIESGIIKQKEQTNKRTNKQTKTFCAVEIIQPIYTNDYLFSLLIRKILIVLTGCQHKKKSLGTISDH